MRISRLEVTGFGRLKNLDLDLAGGLNVVYGLNEAGKSTLQRFIQGMLYGLQKPGSTRENKLPEYERYRPWGGGDYRGALEYELSDGRRFRAERDFGRGPSATRVFDAATGADLSRDFRQDRRHELLFAHEHLKLTDGEFISTCCLPQLSTDQIELADQISERLANLAQAGAEDLSVQKALKTLDEQIGKLGSDGARTKPVAQKRVEVEALSKKLTEAVRTREAILAEETRLQRREAEATGLRAALTEFEARLAATRRRRLEQRLQRIKEYEEGMAQAAATVDDLKPGPDVTDPAVFEPAARARLAEWQEKVRSLSVERDRLTDEASTVQDRLSGLGRAAPAAGSDERVNALRRAQSALKAVDEDLAAARNRPGEDRAALLRSRLAELEANARSAMTVGLAAAIGLAAVGLILGVTVNPALFLLAVLAVPAALWAFSARRSAAAQVGEVRRQVSAAEAEGAQDTQRLRDLQARRAQLLADAGAESSADLDRLIVDMARDQSQRGERRRALEENAAAIRAKLERVGKEVAEANESLRRALTRAGAADIRDYQDRAERYGRYEKQVAEHRRQAELLRQALGGDTRDGIEARLAELAESAPVGVAPFPDADLEVRERELRARHEQASAMERELSRDRGILDGRYGELPDPADLDRRLESARRELDELVADRDVLSTASELIAKASEQVQRRFAPALNAGVVSSVARLTGGTYPDVRVDRGFAMTVIVDGQSHDVRDLSRGTLDQFYFALRLAVTDLLTGGAEAPPFILDDSLVHYDDERAAAALSLLAEVGRTHQVILFTCHRREVTAARAMVARATVIEL